MAKSLTIAKGLYFTDETNPVILFNGELNIDYNGVVTVKFIDKNENIVLKISRTFMYHRLTYETLDTYSITLTNEERAQILEAMSAVRSLKVLYECNSSIANSGGSTVYSSYEAACELIHYEPIFNPVMEAIDERTLTLTGSKDILIHGYGTVQIISNAEARKGASITYQEIICGGEVVESGTLITTSMSNTAYFYAEDSRGVVARDFIVKEVIPYNKVTCYFNSAQLNANGELTFTVSGNFYNGSFGAKENTMELEYGLQENDGDITWYPLGLVEPTIAGENQYSYTYTITGLNYQSQYTLTVNAIDELTSAQTTRKIAAAIPVFDWSAEDFNFNVPVYLKNTNIPLENVADYVIENGYSNYWSYRKWYSGKVELYITWDINNLACNVALGGWYRSAVITNVPNFPFAVSNPIVMGNYISDGYGALIWNTTEATENSVPDCYLMRPTSSSGIYGKLVYYVQGNGG